MNEDELQQQIEDAIAERLPQAVAEAFGNMDEVAKEHIAQSLSRFMTDRQPALRSPKTPYALRWLFGGADVTSNIGFSGPNMPHVINLTGATASINATNSDQLDINVSGGGGAGILTGIGNPGLSADEGTLYWATDTNNLWVNNNGTNGWSPAFPSRIETSLGESALTGQSF